MQHKKPDIDWDLDLLLKISDLFFTVKSQKTGHDVQWSVMPQKHGRENTTY